MNHTLFSIIDNHLLGFCDQVAKEFQLDPAKVRDLWNSSRWKEAEIAPNTLVIRNALVDALVVKEDAKKPAPTDPSKMTVAQLKELCKEKGVPTSGTKPILLARLGLSSTEVKSTSKPAKKSKSPEEEKPSPALIKAQDYVNTNNTISESITVKLNKFNNREHTASGLLIDKETKKAYGRQNADGTVSELTKDDIELCKKYKLSFVIPTNLDKNRKYDDKQDDDIHFTVESDDEDEDEDSDIEVDDNE
jgi:hypothetical protein